MRQRAREKQPGTQIRLLFSLQGYSVVGKTRYQWRELKRALEGGENVFGFQFVCSHKITFLHEGSQTEEYKTTWYMQIRNKKDILESLTFHFSGASLTRYGATNKVSAPDTLMIEYYQEYTKVLEFGLPSNSKSTGVEAIYRPY